MFNLSLCIAARAASRAACSIRGVSLSSILFSKASSRRRTSSSRKVSIQLTSSAKLQQSTRFHLLLDQPSLTGGRDSPLSINLYILTSLTFQNARGNNQFVVFYALPFSPPCPTHLHKTQSPLA